MRLLNISNLFSHSILDTYILIIENILQCKDERLYKTQRGRNDHKDQEGGERTHRERADHYDKSLGLTKACSGIKQFPFLSSHTGEYYELQV